MKHLPTLILAVLTVSGLRATWQLINLSQVPLTTWLLFALFCFGVSAVLRLSQLALYWMQWRERHQPAPAKETPVPYRRMEDVPPDTILQFDCYCCVCGNIGKIQTTKAAYVSDEMNDIIRDYTCTKCLN